MMRKTVTTICALLMCGATASAMNMSEVPYRTEIKETWISGPLDAKKLEKVAKDLGRRPVIRCNNLTLEDFKQLLPMKDKIKGFNLNYCPKVNALTGLSAFPNIEIMQITGQKQDWDLSELAKMKKLRVLSLSQVSYKNMDFLKPLNNLEELDFFMQPKGVSDLSWIKGKTKLRVLKFYNMRSEDITPLEQLTNLELLSLYMVFPKSVAPLAKLKKLKWLDLYAVNCEDLTPVGECSELRVLDLYMTRAKDYSFLGKLTKLENLSATYCDIDSLAFLKNTPKLKILGVYQSKKITDWTGLKDGKSIETLAVSDTSFNDLSLIGDMTKLERLSFVNCKVEDFSPLKALTSLKNLSLEGSTIDSLDLIKDLPNLKELNLQDAKGIKSILPLVQCKNLRSLRVSKEFIPAEEIEKIKAIFKEKKRYLYIWAQ